MIRSGSFLRGVGPAVGAILLLGAATYWALPTGGEEGARIYLERARLILGERPLGTGQPSFSSSTTCVSWLLATCEKGAYLLGFSHGASLGEYLESSAPVWSQVLLGAWALLAAGLALALGGLSRRLAGDWAGVAAAGLFLLSPGLPILLTSLSPAVPSGFLILFLGWRLLALFEAPDAASSSGRRAFPWIEGLGLGFLLAWASYAWVAAAAFLVVAAFGRGRWAAAAGIAVFLGLALEPARLIHPASILPAIRMDWAREGGWGGAGGGSALAVILATTGLGSAAWIFWLPALGCWRERGARPLAYWMGSLWVLQVVLPVFLGLRRPGAVQWMMLPLLAVSAGVGVAVAGRLLAGLRSRRGGPLLEPPAGPGLSPGTLGSVRFKGRATWREAALPAGLAAALLLSALPGRLAVQERLRPPTGSAARMIAEITELVGPDSLWLSERPLPGSLALAGGDAALPGRGLILPRDTRNSGRFYFAYWPRWYAGFRFALLSASEVRQNLERPDAILPRHFYRLLESQGALVRQWGDPRSGQGFRLYRLPEGGTFRRRLTDEDLQEIQGGPTASPFLCELGDLYLRSGDSSTAALLFRQGLRWDSLSTCLYNNLGSVYLLQGDARAACSILEAGLRHGPRSVELLYNLGRAWNEVGAGARAEEFLRRAQEERPDFAPVHYELGRAFLRQNQPRLAAMALRRFLELEPTSPRREQVTQVLKQLQEQMEAAPRPGRGARSREKTGS